MSEGYTNQIVFAKIKNTIFEIITFAIHNLCAKINKFVRNSDSELIT